jgi:hypothetical protein
MPDGMSAARIINDRSIRRRRSRPRTPSLAAGKSIRVTAGMIGRADGETLTARPTF